MSRWGADAPVWSLLLVAAAVAASCKRVQRDPVLPRPVGACPADMVTVCQWGVRPYCSQAFCLDRTEVSAAAFEACVRRGECSAENLVRRNLCTYGVPGKGEHPINCINDKDAARFCVAMGKRLPTEGELEWTAQNESRSTKYPWGDSLPDASRGCFGRDREAGTCPVGAFPTGANALGILDLAGNVWEWTAPQMVDRLGAKRASAHGGAWDSVMFEPLMAVWPYPSVPTVPDYPALVNWAAIGFRCARDGSVAAPGRG